MNHEGMDNAYPHNILGQHFATSKLKVVSQYDHVLRVSTTFLICFNHGKYNSFILIAGFPACCLDLSRVVYISANYCNGLYLSLLQEIFQKT
jgi:hypothetical protein